MLKRYFGFTDESEDGQTQLYEGEHSLEDIGAILGVTRERIRQIKERALERLSLQPAIQELNQSSKVKDVSKKLNLESRVGIARKRNNERFRNDSL